VFREHYGRRLILGMGLICAAGAVLAVGEASSTVWPLGSMAVIGACLAWALDNNLTRNIAGGDPVQIAGIKGLVAGATNLSIAALVGWNPLAVDYTLAALAVGLLGYGMSLVLYIRALRQLGAARTAAYFSTAPFVGAAAALLMLGEGASVGFWTAAALMAIGTWLHVSERHEHLHAHELLRHDHAHTHDEHHRHAHGFSWDGREPHAHAHVHAPLVHSHPHYPDLHHRHAHE